MTYCTDSRSSISFPSVSKKSPETALSNYDLCAFSPSKQALYPLPCGRCSSFICFSLTPVRYLSGRSKLHSINMTANLCIFCCKRGSQLIVFTVTTLKKCNDVLKIRVVNDLAMCIQRLPPKEYEDDCEASYYSLCYQRFTALPRKYRAKVTAQVVQSSNSGVSVPHPENAHVATPNDGPSAPIIGAASC